jgi:prepilin-type processing-associated H-X9-DG protein
MCRASYKLVTSLEYRWEVESVGSRDTRFRVKDLAAILAVVLVLGPILAAGLRHARALSAQISCAENLKALGVACDMYQADFDDVLVPYGAPFAWPPQGIMWPDLLNHYVDPSYGGPAGTQGKLFRCPAVVISGDPGFASSRNYGINVNCGGWVSGGAPLVVKLKSVRYPASTIRLAETEWKASGGSLFAARPDEYVPGDPNCHRFATRHNNTGNVLWIDGHVSAMTIDQYNMRDSGPYSGQIWLRLEPPKPSVAN